MQDKKRPVARISRPSTAGHGDAFSALRITAPMFGAEGSPWFTIDHFRMKGPTFPPHPHAGFSAVTYILPRSANAMLNRDSRGDRSIIEPGGIHWTAAGSGVVHEEIPEHTGEICEGFQIFVRQPPEQERQPPIIGHAAPLDIPGLELPGGARARLLAGEWHGVRAPINPPNPLVMMDVTLPEGAQLEWMAPPGWTCSAYLYDGRATVNHTNEAHAAPCLIAFARTDGTAALHAAGTDCHVLLMAGEPIDAPGYSNGPFLLSSPAAIEDAITRYRNGAMGSLPDAW